ncbi:ABC transporter ATP-binding protein [Petrotoga sibirica]|uniref:ABC-type multidrug transport system fused ATPase/permease subunit n=4 Tax=Petrotoga TaxID=28236 RepID=A0A4R8F5T6_9BACT|nr:ABC transporter ATP-binding protein [Petrotoga sibirica]POZ88872.1 ABC transporter [Petrotoga sibirica DSM 13575]TDX17501.1 ABC-type multidrug transport system fused ATPase/permease subunit [Petrotoga sibirica]
MGLCTRRLIRYGIKNYKKYMIFMFLLGIATLVLAALRPFFIQYLIDDIISFQRINILPFFLIFLIGVVALERVFNYFFNTYHRKVNFFTIKNEQINLYNKIQNSKFVDYSKMDSGDIMSRLLSDIDETSYTMALVLPTMCLNFLNLVVISAILTYLNWQLFLIVLASLPFYWLIIRSSQTKLQNYSKIERKSFGKLTSSIKEKLDGQLIIKVFGKTKYFSNSFSKDAENWSMQATKAGIFQITILNIAFFISYVIPVIILGLGGLLVIRGNMSLGTLIAFYSFVPWIYEPIGIINENLVQLQRVEPLAERFFEILDMPEEEGDGIYLFPKDYNIEYKNVSFKYRDEIVLKNINLFFGKNEKVALVGTSGSGKSTMVSLLVRLYDPTNGKILLGNKNITDYKLQEIREKIKLVRGNEPLFNMTVKENIMLDDEITEEEFMKAVKKAKVDKFIGLLDEGYDTVVGERGSKLSDGQRQRVAIARALIREPKVLILDEATSGVDSQTEEEIFDELKEYKMTLIIISHRLSTIRKANKVILLKDGEIKGEGVHEELLKNAPIYKEIIESQLVV